MYSIKEIFKRDIGFFTIFILYAISAAYLYLNIAYISDEIRFFEVSSALASKGFLGYLEVGNPFSYGSIYFGINSIIIYITDKSEIGLRIFYLIINLSQIYLSFCLAKRHNPGSNVAVLAFILTLPIVWWQGKITGSEQFSNILFLISFYIAITTQFRRIGLAGFIFGLAIGAKLTAVFAMPMFVLGYCAIVVERSLSSPSPRPAALITAAIRHGAIFAGLMLLGFVVANPYLIWSSPTLSALNVQNLPPGAAARPLGLILYGNEYGWDRIFNGGLFTYGAHWSILAILFIAGLLRIRNTWPSVIGFGLALALAIIACRHSYNTFGWYFISILYLLPYFAASVLENFSSSVKKVVFSLLIVVSFSVNALTNLDFVWSKIDEIQSFAKKDILFQYIASLPEQSGVDLVLDLTDYNISLKDMKAKGFLPHAAFITDGHPSLARYYKNPDIDWLIAFRERQNVDGNGIIAQCHSLDSVGSALLVINKRYFHSSIWWNDAVQPRSWISRNIIRSCPGWRLDRYDYVVDHHVLLLKKDVSATFDFTAASPVTADPTFLDPKVWGGALAVTPNGAIIGKNNPPSTGAQTFKIRPNHFYQYRAVLSTDEADCSLRIRMRLGNTKQAEEIYYAPLIKGGSPTTIVRTMQSPDDADEGNLILEPHSLSCSLTLRYLAVMEISQTQNSPRSSKD